MSLPSSSSPYSSGIPQRNEIIEDLEILSEIVAGWISLQYSPRLQETAEKLRRLTNEISELEPFQLYPIAKFLENNKARAKVWTDGSCYRQGFVESRAAFGVYWGEGHPNNHGEIITGDNHDSTRAELFAAYYAIKQALHQNYFAIKLYSDSRFVEEVLKRPSDFLSNRHKNFRDLVSKISTLMESIHVSLVHVRSKESGNRKADELARKATMPDMTKTQRRNWQRREAQRRVLLNNYRLIFLKFSKSLNVFLLFEWFYLKNLVCNDKL